MAKSPAADTAVTELVLEAASFTGPERREVQQRFAHAFGDLLTYTFEAMIVGARDSDAAPMAPLVDPRDGALYFPDDVVQFMLWVQARRADPAATLDQFDHLTLRELAQSRSRGLPKAATGGGPSTTSSTGSGSAGGSEVP